MKKGITLSLCFVIAVACIAATCFEFSGHEVTPLELMQLRASSGVDCTACVDTELPCSMGPITETECLQQCGAEWIYCTECEWPVLKSDCAPCSGNDVDASDPNGNNKVCSGTGNKRCNQWTTHCGDVRTAPCVPHYTYEDCPECEATAAIKWCDECRGQTGVEWEEAGTKTYCELM